MASLPGRILAKNVEGECEYCHLVAVCTKFQGETDSFGHEELLFCEQCEPLFLQQLEDEKKGHCWWCHEDTNDRRWVRDHSEGRNSVHLICPDCRAKLGRELDEAAYPEEYEEEEEEEFPYPYPYPYQTPEEEGSQA